MENPFSFDFSGDFSDPFARDQKQLAADDNAERNIRNNDLPLVEPMIDPVYMIPAIASAGTSAAGQAALRAGGKWGADAITAGLRGAAVSAGANALTEVPLGYALEKTSDYIGGSELIPNAAKPALSMLASLAAGHATGKYVSTPIETSFVRGPKHLQGLDAAWQMRDAQMPSTGPLTSVVEQFTPKAVDGGLPKIAVEGTPKVDEIGILKDRLGVARPTEEIEAAKVKEDIENPFSAASTRTVDEVYAKNAEEVLSNRPDEVFNQLRVHDDPLVAAHEDIENSSVRNPSDDLIDMHFANGASDPTIRAEVNDLWNKADADINDGRLYANPVSEALRATARAYEKYIGTPVWNYVSDNYFWRLLDSAAVKAGENKYLGVLTNLPIHPKFFKADYRPNLPENEAFSEAARNNRLNTQTWNQLATKFGERFMTYPMDEQEKMLSRLREGYGPSTSGIQLTPEQDALVEDLRDTVLHLGKRSVQEGHLDADVFDKNMGSYLATLYSKYESLDGSKLFAKNKMFLDRFRKKEDRTPEQMEADGEIKSIAWPALKTVLQVGSDLEQAKFMNTVARNSNWSVAFPQMRTKVNANGDEVYTVIHKGSPVLTTMDANVANAEMRNLSNGLKDQAERFGFVPLAKDLRLGSLSGSYVHPDVANEFRHVLRDKKHLWDAANHFVKWNLTAGNLPTQVANTISGMFQAHLGGLPFYDQPLYLMKAINEMRNKGMLYLAARAEGLTFRDFTHDEIDSIRRATAKYYSNMNEDDPAFLTKYYRALKGVVDWAWVKPMSKAYSSSDSVLKFMVALKKVDDGMDMKSAMKEGNKALFDYSDQSTYLRNFSSHVLGGPFAVYPVKAIPFLTETAIKYPWRFALPAALTYGIQAITNNETGQTMEDSYKKRKNIPEWMSGGVGPMVSGMLPQELRPHVDHMLANYLELPVRDDYGRTYYFNIGRFTPLGQFVEPKDKNNFAKLPLIPDSLQPLSHPIVSTTMDLLRNKDGFTGRDIVADDDLTGIDNPFERVATIGGKYIGHVARKLAPPPLKMISAMYDLYKGRADYRGRIADPATANPITQMFVRNYPVDFNQEVMNKINKNGSSGTAGNALMKKMMTISAQLQALKDANKKAKYEKYDTSKLQEQLDNMMERYKKAGAKDMEYAKDYHDLQEIK